RLDCPSEWLRRCHGQRATLYRTENRQPAARRLTDGSSPCNASAKRSSSEEALSAMCGHQRGGRKFVQSGHSPTTPAPLSTRHLSARRLTTHAPTIRRVGT